jgi:hypothetical protein
MLDGIAEGGERGLDAQLHQEQERVGRQQALHLFDDAAVIARLDGLGVRLDRGHERLDVAALPGQRPVRLKPSRDVRPGLNQRRTMLCPTLGPRCRRVPRWSPAGPAWSRESGRSAGVRGQRRLRPEHRRAGRNPWSGTL